MSLNSKSYTFLIITICVINGLSGCKKLDREVAVTTGSIAFTDTNVTAQGTVIDLGEGSITDHGHCWSTSTDPTIDDDTTSLGAVSQTGVFSSDIDITNLIIDTTYYIRAYATDGSIVRYGTDESFTITIFEFPCGTVLIDERDGKSYNTVLIGTQCWMAENLKTGTVINSNTSSDDQTDNSVIEKYCYDNVSTYCTDDGGLYQWDEAMQYSTTGGAQGICPAGWYIPTDDEWKTLEKFLGMTQASSDLMNWRGADVGTQLKIGGTSGFDVSGTGFRKVDGMFYDNPQLAYYWSSSRNGTQAWCRGFSDSLETMYRNTVNKSYGFCVRCVKD